MKTPLNELLDWIKEFEDKPVHPTLTNMKEKVWQLLPKEKEQLEDAFNKGCENADSINYFKLANVILNRKHEQ